MSDKGKKKSPLEVEQELLEDGMSRVNNTIGELGFRAARLNTVLEILQLQFGTIRGLPVDYEEKTIQAEKARQSWHAQTEEIQKRYNDIAVAKNGAAAAAAGVGIAAMGPSVAMGIATTFGVASTGTPIAALAGAAAQKAALAWLGGGALAAGGGGMAAGNAFLAMAGPVGWAIAGVSVLGSGVITWIVHEEKKSVENTFTLIARRDRKKYELALVELNERIRRIDDESTDLIKTIVRIGAYGTDYSDMSEEQKYHLGAAVNLCEAATQLLTNPILGLLPDYSEADLEQYCVEHGMNGWEPREKELCVYLACLLYGIPLEEKDLKHLFEYLSRQKEFQTETGYRKKELKQEMFARAVCLWMDKQGKAGC